MPSKKSSPLKTSERVILVKNKLAKSKYTFSKGLAIHHLPSIGYFNHRGWLYLFDTEQPDHKQSILLLQLSSLILWDSAKNPDSSLEWTFNIQEEYERINRDKKSILLEIKKAETLLNYHKFILEETSAEKLNPLKERVKRAKEHKKHIPKLSHSREDLLRKISLDLRLLFKKI